MQDNENNSPESRISNLEPDSSPESRTSNLEPVSSPQSQTLIDYLQVIAKRSRMIFFVTLAAAIVSIIYSLFLPNIYTAKTMILPSQEDKGMMTSLMAQLGGMASIAGGTGFTFGGPTMADLYASMLKSESVKDPIIDRFNLMEVFKNKYRTDTYKALERNTVIMTNKKDGIVTITVDDRDPKRAADIANSYVEELGNLAIRLNITGAVKNRAYLEERLTKARADLANAEDNLKEFQSKNKAVQITSQAEATIKGVADIRARLALQEVQLATYRRQFTESSQEVKNLVASIGNLKSQIAKLEGMGENSTIPSLGAVPALGQEYLRRMREFKIQESLVEVLTKQYEITRLSEARNVSPIQVIQKAKAPERKSKPSRSKFVIKATATIFFFSLIITFVLEHLSKMSDEDRTRWNDIWADLCFFRMKKL